jgi:hypothetical protein
LHAAETEDRAVETQSAASKIFGRLKERVVTMKTVLEEQLGVSEDEETSEDGEMDVRPMPPS